MVRSGRFIGAGVGALLGAFASAAPAQSWLSETPKEKPTPQIHVFNSVLDCEDTLAKLGVQENCLHLFADAVSALPSFKNLEDCRAYQSQECYEVNSGWGLLSRTTWKPNAQYAATILDKKVVGDGFPVFSTPENGAYVDVNGLAINATKLEF